MEFSQEAVPILRALRDDGAYAVARCHLPTSSAINWCSVFTGQPPEIHGYNLWNSQEPGIEPPHPAFGEAGAIPDLFSEGRRSLYAFAGLGTVSAKALFARAMHAAVAKRTPGPKRSQTQPPSSA